MKFLLLIVWGALISSLTYGLTPHELLAKKLATEATQLFLEARNSTHPIDTRCSQLYAQAFKLAPNHFEYEAFEGSAKCIQARDSLIPLEKLALVQDGITLMDSAVKSQPENIISRQIRAETDLELPDIFQRRTQAEADINFLIRTYLKDPNSFSQKVEIGRILLLKARCEKFNGNTDLSLKFAQEAKKTSRIPKTIHDAETLIHELEE